MPETMTPQAAAVDAVASYRDPRAAPLRDAAKLLDLVYPELDDEQLRDQIVAPRVRDGRFRVIGYEHPRQLSGAPVLLPQELVKAAFQDLRSGVVFDPVHDRLLGRQTVIGKPSRRMLAIPGKMEEWRELQRLMALPPAIDWTGCAVRAGRYAFVNCKVIRKEDLSHVDLVSEVAEAPEATRAEELTRDLPPPSDVRLKEVLTNLMREEPSWYHAGEDRLAVKVAEIDPRFRPNTGTRKVGRWNEGTLKWQIRNVRKEAWELATELGKKSPEN